MECYICLSEFETDYALIPELSCSCIIVVHQGCWIKWNGTCIYCRAAPKERGYIVDFAELALVRCRITICKLVYLAYLVYLIYLVYSLCLISDSYGLPIASVVRTVQTWPNSTVEWRMN